MALIKNTTDLKKYAPSVWSSFDFDDILPMVTQVDNDIIKKILGVAQYNALSTSYNTGTPALTAAQTALLNVLQPALAQLTLWYSIPQLNVSLNNGGLVVPNSANHAPASQWRVEDFMSSTKKLGYSALDIMLEFMETNKADYPLWTADAAYTLTRNSFLNSANEFTTYYGQLQNSRWLYLNLRPIMKRLEEDSIKTITGTALFDEIKSQISGGGLTAENTKLLTYIRPGIAYLTIAEAVNEISLIMDDKGLTFFETNKQTESRDPRKKGSDSNISKMESHCRNVANVKLTQLATYLNDNALTYPLFAADATVYTPDSDSKVENSDDNNYVALI